MRYGVRSETFGGLMKRQLLWAWIGWMALAATPVQAAAGGRWADKVVLDPMSSSMMFVYFDNDVPSAERNSFGAVDAVWYVPLYEGQVEEASLVMSNGEQILISKGATASQDAMLIAAILGQRPVLMPPDTVRLVPPGVADLGPRLVLGAVDNPTAMQPLSGSFQSDTLLSGMDIPLDEVSEEVTYDAPPDFIRSTDNQGELERSAIEIGLQNKMQTFRNCYQRQIQRTPNLPGGRITVQFVIDTDGIVDRARVASSSLQNEAVEQCIVQNLEGTQFPLPRNNGTVVVSYPFTFTRR